MKRLEGFEVLAALGEGAFGRVLHVRRRADQREFALKLVEVGDQAGRARREIAAAQAVDHPAVLRCFEAGVDEGTAWMLLELAQGDLVEVVRDPDRRGEAWDLVRQAGAGVAALHRAGLVHRDLKPANLLRTPAGPKVSDLGLVRGDHFETLTATGVVLGTPAYMAPEQVRGEAAGPGADVYALARIFLEVAGEDPSEGLATGPLMVRRARGELPRLEAARAGLGARALAALRQGLAADPGARPGDLTGWLDELGDWRTARASSPVAAAGPGPTATRVVGSGRPGEARRRGGEADGRPGDDLGPRAPTLAGAAPGARPSGDAPGSRRRRWPWVAVAGLALVWVLARPGSPPEAGPGPHGATGRSAEAEDEGRGPPRIAGRGSRAGVTPPDFEHLPARLEAELAALGEAWYRPRDDELWSAAEVATMAEPGHEPEGFTPATGPAAHPRSWLLVRARLPACEALVEWLAAGGDPRDLGEPARQGLARADVLLEEMGLPATFRPHLRVVPIDAVVELGAEAREFFEGSRAPAGDGVDGEPGSRRCPPWRPGSTCQPRRSGWEAALARGAGWAGAAVTWVEAAALEARRAEQALLQAAFERREARGLFWDGALAPTVRDVVQRQVLADTFTRSPREVIQEFPLEFLPYDADLERRYGRWLTPLTEALVSAFAALARVADGGDPNEGPAAALAAMHLGSALRHSFVGAWYRLDPVQVLAARARTPYGHFVRAQLLDRGGRYQATPDAARRLAVLREFEAAAADPGPSAGRYARDFQRMVRMGLTATRLKLGRLQEMLDAFPALRADLQGESAAVLADAFTRTAVAMVLAGRTGPAAPEDLRALLAVMQQDPAPSATYRTVRREVEALRESVGPHDLVAPTRPEVLAFLRRAATR